MKPGNNPLHEHNCPKCGRAMDCQPAWRSGSRFTTWVIPVRENCWLDWEKKYPCPKCRAKYKVVLLDRVSPEIAELIKKKGERRALSRSIRRKVVCQKADNRSLKIL